MRPGVAVPLPDVFQALITTTVTMAIAARTTSTTLVSSPRFRRAGRTDDRRGRESTSSPTTKRELYSSTYSWPSRPRYSA